MRDNAYSILLYVMMLMLLSGCAIFPTKLPKDRESMSYTEVLKFMEYRTQAKGPNAYSRLMYVSSEQGYHIIEGSVSPAPIKFTSFGVDRYRFRVTDSNDLPDYDSLVRVYGRDHAFIKDFWGEHWQRKPMPIDLGD